MAIFLLPTPQMWEGLMCVSPRLLEGAWGKVCLHPATDASPVEKAEERGLTASRGLIRQQDELLIRTRSQKEESMKYAVIIEAGERNYSAYVEAPNQ